MWKVVQRYVFIIKKTLVATEKIISDVMLFTGRRRVEPKSVIFQHLDMLSAEMYERLAEELERNSREPISFRLEVKCCRYKNHRNSDIRTLLGEAFRNKCSKIEKSELFENLKTKIDEFDLNDDKASKIVEINVTAKFPKLDDDDL